MTDLKVSSEKGFHALWQRFDVIVRDPKMKVLFYPIIAVLGAILVAAGAGGRWVRTEDGWVEQTLAHPMIETKFKELQRDARFIYLVDPNRVKDDSNRDNFLLLRLPIDGGMAQTSWSNPTVWSDLTPVKPE